MVIIMSPISDDNETNLQIINYHEALSQATLDEKVNIKIAPLAGDKDVKTFVTELKSGAKITAHVHSQGIELYHILKGKGEIYTGKLVHDKVTWSSSRVVKEGDVFAITAGTVDQLKNASGDDPLALMFMCPESHLKEDRIITADY